MKPKFIFFWYRRKKANVQMISAHHFASAFNTSVVHWNIPFFFGALIIEVVPEDDYHRWYKKRYKKNTFVSP